MTVAEMIRRLEKINIEDVTTEAIEATEDAFVEQQKAQMFAGLYKTGAFIRPPYASSTKVKKIKDGLPVDRVTTRETGRFHNGIFVQVRDRGTYTVNSTREVNGYILGNILAAKYGNEIWGLGGQFKSDYLVALHAAMRDKINLIIRGNFS